MAGLVTVAIPVLNGGPLLRRALAAVAEQEVDGELELVVADSGSTDGSREAAQEVGATVIDVPRAEFSHGGTRNLLMESSRGAHVAFLTQDALPADSGWLARLLAAFELADDVGLTFGPYRPRPGASVMVRRELDEVFAALGHEPRLDDGPFFSSANGCVARRAWERVGFRKVAYAEDRMLARDMLSAGWAKAYHPAAAVIHSHEYPLRKLVQRSFDEGRGMLEVNGFRGHSLTTWPLVVQRAVRDDAALGRAEGKAGPRLWGASFAHHGARALGGALGGRADRIPARARRFLSLEGHEGFDTQAEHR